MPDILVTGYSAGEIAFVLLSALIAGLARGFSGFGAALILIPLASSVVGPKVASALLLTVDGILTLGMIPNAWRNADRREVGTMALGALAGIPLGTAVLALGDPLVLRWAISLAIMLLLAFLMSGWRYRQKPKTGLTITVGGVAGLFSGAAQVGGPPVVAYWLGSTLNSTVVRANIVLYFAISTAFSVVSYYFGGLFVRQVFVLTALTAPCYGLGLFAGARLFGLASDQTFRRICYALIGAAAIIGLPLFDAIIR